jgi:hypothetical protein
MEEKHYQRQLSLQPHRVFGVQKMTLAEHCLYKMEHSGPPIWDLKAGRVRGRLVYSDRCFSAGIRNGVGALGG